MSEVKTDQTAQANTEAGDPTVTPPDPEKQKIADSMFDGGESNDKGSPTQEKEKETKPDDDDSEKGEAVDKSKDDEKNKDDKSDAKEEVKPDADGDKTSEEVTVKLPSGSGLSEADANEIAAIAKDEKLTQAQTDKLVATTENVVKRYQDRQQELLESTQDEWEASVKADKEIGGENENLSIRYAQKAINQFGNDEFKKELEVTKLGSHPEVIRVFARIGRAISDDTLVSPKETIVTPKSMAEVLYPTNETKQ